MKKIIYFVLVSIVLAGCGKEPKDKEYRTPVNPHIIDIFAPAGDGSYYVYQEELSGLIDTLWVSNYREVGQHTYSCGRDTVPLSKRYTLESLSGVSGIDFNIFINSNCTGSSTVISYFYGIGGEDILIAHNDDLSDFNSNPLGIYQEAHEVKGVQYNDVYSFIQPVPNYSYVYAKNIGLIQIYKDYYTDSLYGENWELIDYHLNPRP